MRRVVVLALAVAAAACRSEPRDQASHAPSKATPAPASAAPVTAAPPVAPPQATASASADAALPAPRVTLEQLLEGGPALGSLPVRATDDGAEFDPALRNKLGPARARVAPPSPR